MHALLQLAALSGTMALAALLALCAPADAQVPAWVTLAPVERVTFYGPHYAAGDLTASGIRYAPDDDVVALGPDLLAMVRAHYARRAGELGQPLAWGRTRQGHLVYQGIAGAFPVAVTWRSVAWWGHLVRVCAAMAGGGELCREVRVADTGRPALQVDLPDETWQAWGWPAGKGFFAGRLEVLE
jgi:hypothetical protein